MPADLPPSTPEVEVVVVHAPRLAPLGGDSVFSAVQIDADDLKQKTRVDEALKQAPGVSLFRRTGSGAANPTTQGLSLRAIAPSGAGRALVTLDGTPQNDPFGGWVIWTALPGEGLDGATVVRGAGAGPYGAGALTGVVNLQERGAGDGLLAADLSVAERDSYRAVIAGGGEHALFTLGVSDTDGYYAVRGARQGPADTRLQLKDKTGAMRAQGEFGGVQAAFRVSAYQVEQEAGLRGARSNATGGSASLTFAKPAADGVGGWRLQGWVRRSDLENSSVAVAANRQTTTPANAQYSAPTWGYGVNAAVQGRLDAVAWEAGVDMRIADGTEHELFRFMNGAFTRNRDAGGETFVGGGYIEAAYDQGPWIVTGGVRLDYSNATDAKRIERDVVTKVVTLNQQTPNRTDTTPTGRFGVRYELSDSLYLRSAAYAGFRPPTLNELHRPFRVGNDITEANPQLKPETLQGVEAGIGGEAPFQWSAAVFYNVLKDPITNVTIGVGPGTFLPQAGFIPAGGTLRQRQNAGEIEAWGLEAEASGDVLEGLSWRAAAGYTDAEVHGGRSAPQLTGLRPAQTPKWTVTGGLDWTSQDVPLTFSANVRYESGRWEDDLNTRRLSPGALVDARAGWRLNDTMEVYVAAENLFDEKLEVAEAADGTESFSAPQTFRIGFSYRR